MNAQKNLYQELQEKRINDSAPDLANALNAIVNSVFQEYSRIGYELIQNADDASETDAINREVDFYMLKDYLLIAHNGKHFTEKDVRALCQYGTKKAEAGEEEHDKQTSLKKTGYKGIGFKSVFRISEEVSVFSKDYNFKFDKNHWEGQQLPWQIMPIGIAIDDYPAEVRDILDAEKVTFLVKLKEIDDKSKRKIVSNLENILKSYKIILFLRHMKRLSFYREMNTGIELRREVTRTNNDSARFKVEVKEPNGESSETYWRIDKFKFKIPQYLRYAIQHEDERICPKKMKEAKELEISLAAKLREDGSIIAVTEREGYLYSFLPTTIQRSYPFVANALFIMNAARTSLVLPNQWNEYIMEQIGYFQFEWYKRMQDDEQLKFEFTKLVKKYATDTRDSLNISFNKGVERAKKEIAFVPVMENTAPQMIRQTIVDSTYISSQENKVNLVKESMGTDNYIVNPNLHKIKKLVSYGAKEFSIQKLRDAIRQTTAFKTPVENSQLIEFFFKRVYEIEGNERSEWNKVLKEMHFVLNDENALRMPEEVYFPEEMETLSFALSLSFIHEEVYQNTIRENRKLQDWLKRLGVAPPSPIDIIRKGIFEMVRNKDVNHSNVIPITQYIMPHYWQLPEQEQQFLRTELPVLTKNNNLIRPYRAHLSDVYQPKLPLEDVLTEDIFVSEKYLPDEISSLEPSTDEAVADDNSEAITEIQTWNQFLVRMGVKQDLELELFEGFYRFNHSSLLDKQDFVTYIKPYLPEFKKSTSHGLLNMLYPWYFEKVIENRKFAEAYWRNIFEVKQWKELLKKSKRCVFQHHGGRSAVPNYFNFLVENRSCFPATDGNCYPTKEIYSKSLEHIVGNSAPISFIETERHHEDFLNIKGKLSLEECLAFLQDIAESETTEKERIASIYQYIIDQRFTAKDLEEIDFYGDDFSFLANNNSFKAKSELYYLNLPKFAKRADSEHFIYLELPDDEAKVFCELFGITVVDLEALEFIKGNETNNSLEKVWNRILPFIACLFAEKKGKLFQEEQDRLTDITVNTSFLSYNQLQLVYYNEENDLIYRKEIKAWMEEDALCLVEPWMDRVNRYDLIGIMTQRFNLQSLGQELDLFLGLKTSEIIKWLEDHGYDIPDVPLIVSPVDEAEEDKEDENDKETIFTNNTNTDVIVSSKRITDSSGQIIEPPEPPSEFEKEMQGFIDTLQNTVWSSHIENLKQLLLGVDNTEEKKKICNMVAKIKLGVQIGAKDDGTEDYNFLTTEEEKYIVHSARGPFAYIHPTEIIDMHENGAIIAIDWGADRVSIYNNPLELLNKNEIQLLRYSGEQDLDSLLEFCQQNSSEKRHLLFVDGGVSINKNKSILKILGPQDDY
jgi:hypothetical protein